MKHINFQRGLVTQIVVIVALVVIAGTWLAVSKKEPAPAAVSSGPITLLTPNGGETLAIGSPVNVTFKTEGEMKDSYRVVIWLDEGAAPLATISARATSYSLTIPDSILIGGDARAPLAPGSYKLRVSLYDGEPCIGLCQPSAVKELGSDTSDGMITIVTSSPASSIMKTYRNDKLGYEIKYPSDWTVREFSKEFVAIVSAKFPGQADTDVPYENVSIRLQEADCIAKPWERGGNPAGDVTDSFKTACVPENKKIEISLFSMEEGSKKVEDQILSTFRFTSTAPTAMISTSTAVTQ